MLISSGIMKDKLHNFNFLFKKKNTVIRLAAY